MKSLQCWASCKSSQSPMSLAPWLPCCPQVGVACRALHLWQQGHHAAAAGEVFAILWIGYIDGCFFDLQAMMSLSCHAAPDIITVQLPDVDQRYALVLHLECAALGQLHVGDACRSVMLFFSLRSMIRASS